VKNSKKCRCVYVKLYLIECRLEIFIAKCLGGLTYAERSGSVGLLHSVNVYTVRDKNV